MDGLARGWEGFESRAWSKQIACDGEFKLGLLSHMPGRAVEVTYLCLPAA